MLWKIVNLSKFVLGAGVEPGWLWGSLEGVPSDPGPVQRSDGRQEQMDGGEGKDQGRGLGKCYFVPL